MQKRQAATIFPSLVGPPSERGWRCSAVHRRNQNIGRQLDDLIVRVGDTLRSPD